MKNSAIKRLYQSENDFPTPMEVETPAISLDHEATSNKVDEARENLMKIFKELVDEFSVESRHQIAVVFLEETSHNFDREIIATCPLKHVLSRKIEAMVDDLEAEMRTEWTNGKCPFSLPHQVQEHEPVQLENMKMTTLRGMIPKLIKLSNNTRMCYWNNNDLKPAWWPNDVPFKNVKMDSRTEEQKQQMPWINALRKIVYNCFRYYGQSDLLAVQEATKIHPEENKSVWITGKKTSIEVTPTSLRCTIPVSVATEVSLQNPQTVDVSLNAVVNISSGELNDIEMCTEIQTTASEGTTSVKAPTNVNVCPNTVKNQTITSDRARVAPPNYTTCENLFRNQTTTHLLQILRETGSLHATNCNDTAKFGHDQNACDDEISNSTSNVSDISQTENSSNDTTSCRNTTLAGQISQTVPSLNDTYDHMFNITTLDVEEILSPACDLTNIFFIYADANDVTHVAPIDRIENIRNDEDKDVYIVHIKE